MIFIIVQNPVITVIAYKFLHLVFVCKCSKYYQTEFVYFADNLYASFFYSLRIKEF